jgi:type I restriction enzyme S subunit
MAFQPVPFRRFLKPNLRPYALGFEEDANLVGMRLYGDGPFHRELKPALKIAKKSHFVIREGDVIYNKLFAWKGAFGIVPPELDGMFVSDKFPTYELDCTQVDPRYLTWFFRHPDVWDQARGMSTGSAALSKLTLNPPRFLDLKIPLPRIDVQQAIGKHLDVVHEKLVRLAQLRSSSEADANLLLKAARASKLNSLAIEGTLIDILISKPRNGWSPTCDNIEGGTPILTLSAVTGWDFDDTAIKLTSASTSPNAHYWLQAGNLLITRSNTPELVGHVAIYDGNPSPCIYPDLIMKMSVNLAKADPKFVWHWMQSDRVREFIHKRAKGTSPTMKKIAQGDVCAVPFPTRLSLNEQIEIAAELDRIRARLQELRALQSKTADDAGAIMPEVLRKAFSGELAACGSDANTTARALAEAI